MNWPAFRSITDDWLLADLSRIIFQYALPAPHRWRPGNPMASYETDVDQKLAFSTCTGVRIWTALRLAETERTWRLTIVSDQEASDIRVGIGSSAAERSYSVNMLLQYRDGFGYLSYGPRNPISKICLKEYNVTVTIDVYFRRTSADDKSLPKVNVHYGYQDFYERRRFLTPQSKSAIRSLATVRFEINGRSAVVDNVPDIDDFVPYLEFPNGSATIVDGGGC